MKFRFELNLVKLVSVSTCSWLLGFVCYEMDSFSFSFLWRCFIVVSFLVWVMSIKYNNII